jgi:signal transduction histidine kinase
MRERSRVIRDIHDGLLQSLTAAGLQLRLLADHAAAESRSKLEMVKDLLANEQRRIRTIMQSTDDKQAAPAFRLDSDLRQLLGESARHWNCEIALDVTPVDASIPSSLGVQLSFLIVEAIANAVRHGGASQVNIDIQAADNHLGLVVGDNGRGFHKTARYAGESGAEYPTPKSIRSRVLELQGSLDIVTSGRGAELQIRLPVT